MEVYDVLNGLKKAYIKNFLPENFRNLPPRFQEIKKFHSGSSGNYFIIKRNDMIRSHHKNKNRLQANGLKLAWLTLL